MEENVSVPNTRARLNFKQTAKGLCLLHKS